MTGSVENGFTMGSNSWGQRIDALGDEYFNPANSPYRLSRTPYDISDFYRVGSNFNNSVALSGGTKVAQTYFSYGNTTANGIVDTNKFMRHNISLRQSFSFSKINSKLTFRRITSTKRPKIDLPVVRSSTPSTNSTLRREIST